MKCPHCGKDSVKLTKDHIVPRAFGGSNHTHNIRKICGECNNNRKTRMTLLEMLEMGKHPPMKIFRHTPTIPYAQFMKAIVVVQAYGGLDHRWIAERKERKAYLKSYRAFRYTT
jgi:hypothetical protein